MSPALASMNSPWNPRLMARFAQLLAKNAIARTDVDEEARSVT